MLSDVPVRVSHGVHDGCHAVNDAPLRSMVVVQFAKLLSMLALALPLACAGGRPPTTVFDEDSTVELFRRPTPPKPRIPGAIASGHRHASNVPAMRLTAA